MSSDWENYKKTCKKVTSNKKIMITKSIDDHEKANIFHDHYYKLSYDYHLTLNSNRNNISSNRNINILNKKFLDKKTIKRFDEKKIEIHAKIDLHHHNLISAFYKFIDFVKESHKKGFKNLVIITGKGSNNDGKIKNHLDKWLNNQQITHLINTCIIDEKNQGSYYLFLKNN